MRIVLLGAPGCGKGTQGAHLAHDYRIPRLSTGDALRAAVAAKSVLGLRAKAAMDAGQLVSDEIVTGLVEERLAAADTANGFILDGFPRNESQARTLDAMLVHLGRAPIDHAVHLRVDEAELIERLQSRGRVEGRADDNVETIRSRLEVYRNQTQPLLDYYAQQHKLLSFEGVGDVLQIRNRLIEALGASRAESASI